MAGSGLPVQLDLVMYAATTFHREFRWLSDGTNGQDLTGWTAAMLVGPLHGAALKSFSSPTGGITLAADGTISITVDPADTEALPTTDSLSYQFDLTDPAGVITRFLRGRCSIVHDVEPLP